LGEQNNSTTLFRKAKNKEVDIFTEKIVNTKPYQANNPAALSIFENDVNNSAINPRSHAVPGKP